MIVGEGVIKVMVAPVEYAKFRSHSLVQHDEITMAYSTTSVAMGLLQPFFLREKSVNVGVMSRFRVEKGARKHRENMSFLLAKPYGPGLKSQPPSLVPFTNWGRLPSVPLHELISLGRRLQLGVGSGLGLGLGSGLGRMNFEWVLWSCMVTCWWCLYTCVPIKAIDWHGRLVRVTLNPK